MNEFVKVAQVEDIPGDSCLSVEVGDLYIALTKVDDEILAFEDACSHDGAEMAHGKLEGDVITCPRHFAKFNIRSGDVLAMPATSPIRVFKTRVTNGEVEVEIDE